MVVIDAIGLKCPLPVLKLRKRLSELEPGKKVTLLTDDVAALVDVPHFCAEAGEQLLDQSEEQGALRFVIRKS